MDDYHDLKVVARIDIFVLADDFMEDGPLWKICGSASLFGNKRFC